MPAHTKLKTRQGSQVIDRQKALKESLLKLQKAEQAEQRLKKQYLKTKIDPQIEEDGRLKLLQQTTDVDDVAISAKYKDVDADASDDDGDNGNDDGGGGGGWSDVEGNAKDNGNGSDSDSGDDLDASSDEDSDDDDDNDDDEAALQAELAKIRAEREAIKRKEEEEKAAIEEGLLEEAALLGNPLLATESAAAAGAGGTGGRMKRRWNEDVVFRNQARNEPEIKKRFINDTVRNDFHKRFLNKFIQ